MNIYSAPIGFLIEWIIGNTLDGCPRALSSKIEQLQMRTKSAVLILKLIYINIRVYAHSDWPAGPMPEGRPQGADLSSESLSTDDFPRVSGPPRPSVTAWAEPDGLTKALRVRLRPVCRTVVHCARRRHQAGTRQGHSPPTVTGSVPAQLSPIHESDSESAFNCGSMFFMPVPRISEPKFRLE
jgi:hypothetical protein